MLLDYKGRPTSERERVETPQPATPEAVIAVMDSMAKKLTEYDRVSIGFPGVVKRGVTYTAHNLNENWTDEEHRLQLVREEIEEVPGLGREVFEACKHPVRAVQAVTELEDGDRRDPAPPGRELHQHGGPHDEKGEVDQGDLIWRMTPVAATAATKTAASGRMT